MDGWMLSPLLCNRGKLKLAVCLFEEYSSSLFLPFVTGDADAAC